MDQDYGNRFIYFIYRTIDSFPARNVQILRHYVDLTSTSLQLLVGLPEGEVTLHDVAGHLADGGEL